MSRDMKPRRQPAPRKSGGGTLVGLFIGLVIGVIAAAAVVWYINKTPTPFTNKPQGPAPASSNAPAPAANEKSNNNSAAPAALPGKPGDPAPEAGSDKPRFDFYKILPGAAEPTPDTKPSGKGDSDAKGKSDKSDKAEKSDKADSTALKEPTFLQAGSFQSAGDADNQKAKLAMMGVEATVQQVMVQDKVWYRVRLGPFSRSDDLAKTRADLSRQGVDATVVKKD
ncbi:SPOR domain-containing protein [Rhodocyclus tenuis]|uniref:SPOR domain-containing protein n=2 Tax=Rhodocyclus gracilis TaxID=2929842 RepID=A0ABX0WIS8_9RHOO|nr:SPOR domain-containing protein [Rhodocyclus gracilis]NJA89210.1 SPOR domain-containing protein [Rhodocyclus gracilis]